MRCVVAKVVPKGRFIEPLKFASAFIVFHGFLDDQAVTCAICACATGFEDFGILYDNLFEKQSLADVSSLRHIAWKWFWNILCETDSQKRHPQIIVNPLLFPATCVLVAKNIMTAAWDAK